MNRIKKIFKSGFRDYVSQTFIVLHHKIDRLSKEIIENNKNINKLNIITRKIHSLEKELQLKIDELTVETNKVKEINRLFKMGGEISIPPDGGCRAIVFYTVNGESNVKYYEFRDAQGFMNMAKLFERRDIDQPKCFMRNINTRKF